MSASGAYGDGQAVVDETFEWDHRPILLKRRGKIRNGSRFPDMLASRHSRSHAR